jgi:hypothetical protein
MTSFIPGGLRRIVAERAEYLCEYCLLHEEDTHFGCQIDHVISEKHGGPTADSNLAYACIFCNRFKGSDIASVSRRTGRLCRLFNPRTDHWAEHFKLNGTSIHGVSEIGEVTVELLGFNQYDRLTERELLIELGRYPSIAARMRMTLPSIGE